MPAIVRAATPEEARGHQFRIYDHVNVNGTAGYLTPQERRRVRRQVKFMVDEVGNILVFAPDGWRWTWGGALVRRGA